ncbi:hypothetical protein BGX38DRAFT_457905 [Terfezia claveryi]|nr:hypothetical protein BGX38DRAFT_457905 [Terfezia claveryi]
MTGSRSLPFEGSAYAFGTRSGSSLPSLRNLSMSTITSSSLYLSFIFCNHRFLSSACSHVLHLLPTEISRYKHIRYKHILVTSIPSAVPHSK